MNQENCQRSYVGNSVEVCTDCITCESEIRADVVVAKEHCIRLWGQVRDCNGYPVPNALIKLLEIVDCKGMCSFTGIAHTVSDCEGFYQFDLCAENPCARYKVLVSAANTGAEKVIGNGSGTCAPCYREQCPPCHPSADKCDPCVKVTSAYGCAQPKRC